VRALFLLLLLPPLAGAQADPCAYATHVERGQGGYWVVLDAHSCGDARAARRSTAVLVTQGPPADNRSETVASANLTHERFGDRAGAFDVREHLQAQAAGHRVDAWYNSTRDASGHTRCSLYANLTHPRGNGVVRQPLPACVPQDLLLP